MKMFKSKEDTMNVRQQIIQDRVEQVAKQLGLSEQTGSNYLDKAFLKYVLSIITNRSIFDRNMDGDIVDGKMEKQIDAIYFDTDLEDQLKVYIVQGKNTNGFSSNVVGLIANGLEWLFNSTQKELSTLDNPVFRSKIKEYRSYQGDLGPSNIQIFVIFATTGMTSELLDTDEVIQERERLLKKYQNGTFAEFKIELWGADELVERMNQLDRKSRKVDQDIRIIYDTNNPSVIRYQAGGIKGIVCSASAKEVARIVNEDKNGAIFEPNIRNFLGLKGAVNSEILSTSISETESLLFWFLNNGITIICDHCDLNPDPDNPIVKVENLQIVNGCQTSTALAIAAKEGKLKDNVRVLLRIYETTDKTLVDRIVLTTNNQNRITTRDLKANDPIQKDFQTRFKEYGYYYERKPREFDNQRDIDSSRVLTNESVAQSYLAIVLKKPSDSSRRKYKVWKDYYSQIFDRKLSVVEPYLLATLIYQNVFAKLKSLHSISEKSELWHQLINSASFQIARIVSFLYHGGDLVIPQQREKYKETINKFKSEIEEIGNNNSVLDEQIILGVDILEAVITSEPSASIVNLENIIKSSELDSQIDAELYKKHRKK